MFEKQTRLVQTFDGEPATLAVRHGLHVSNRGVGDATVAKKLKTEQERQAKLDFSKSACISKAQEKWSSKETQSVQDVLTVRAKHMFDTISAANVGWIDVLDSLKKKLDVKEGDETSLNYSTASLIEDGRTLAHRAEILKEEIKKGDRWGMVQADIDVTLLHSDVVSFTSQANDQAEGMTVKLQKLSKCERSRYQTSYQLDSARCDLLVKGGHGVTYSKLIVAFVNEVEVQGEESYIEQRAKLLGNTFNSTGNHVDIEKVMLWDANHFAGAFPKVHELMNTRAEYLQTRCADTTEALADSTSLLGTVAALEGMNIETDTFGPLGQVHFVDFRGAQGTVLCAKGCALRQGALALMLAGFANLLIPLNKPIFLFLSRVGDICDLGGITLGSSLSKYMDSEDAKGFFKDKVVKLKVFPGEAVFLPYACWPQVLYFEEPARGRDKKKQQVGSSNFLLFPVCLEKQGNGHKDEVNKAIFSNNQAAFDKKKDKVIWQERRALFDNLIAQE